jgi:hypothetical protein
MMPHQLSAFEFFAGGHEIYYERFAAGGYPNTKKRKDKFALEHAMKAQRGSGYMPLLFL